MTEHTRPTTETREIEREEANAPHEAGTGPTPEEAAAADESTASEETAENYEEALERGANVKGEGRID